MKISQIFTRCRALLALACLSIAAVPSVPAAQPVVSDPVTLHVQLNVPPSWNTLNTLQLEEDFVDGVGELLRRNGFPHAVQNIAWTKRGEKTPYVLTINLLEWRMGRTGFVDCTFGATLESPRGTRHLGIYHGSGFHMRGLGHWALAQEFDDAASAALNRLCRDIIRSEVMPGSGGPAA